MSLPVDCFFLSLFLFSFFPFFFFLFLSVPLTALRPVSSTEEFSTGWNESKNEKETFGLVFPFFFFFWEK